ncbi:hypothetical protein P7K49_040992, partial [Saguinus oedipus]
SHTHLDDCRKGVWVSFTRKGLCAIDSSGALDASFNMSGIDLSLESDNIVQHRLFR